MKKSFLVPALVLLAVAGLVAFWQWPNKPVPASSSNGAELSPARVQSGGPTAATARSRAASRKARLRSDQILELDPRRIALSGEEVEWMQRHYFPGDAALESLARLDTVPLRGTQDPMLATLHGLKLMEDKDWGGATAVLRRAATMGSIYAYEESAIAEYRLGLERFGPSIDNDDVFRARLEVARILGDYKVDYLVDRYLPDYQMQQRAHYVQLHITVFLGKLGEDAQLRGLPIPGPDPRPNAQAWQKLREDAKRDPTTIVDAYVLE